MEGVEQGSVSYEEPAMKKSRVSVTSGREISDQTGSDGQDHDVYYSMNVVIQSRAFEMKQEILEGNLI